MEENDRAAQRWRRVWTPLLAAALFFTTASLAAAAQEIALQMDPLHSTIDVYKRQTETVPQMYDAADSILAQKLAQVSGVGQVFVGGAAQPGVRAEVNPMLLNKLGVG